MTDDDFARAVADLEAFARKVDAGDPEWWYAEDLPKDLVEEGRRIAKTLAAFGPLEVVTECRDFDGFGYTITATAHRTFRAGDRVIAEWSFKVSGTGQQFGTGLWLDKDEGLPFPPPVFEILCEHPEEFDLGNFPSDWWEALAILEGDEEEDSDGAAEEDGTGAGDDGSDGDESASEDA